MQVRKITALGKPGLISRTFFTGQEMTGDRIHDHHTTGAFFHIFFFESRGTELEVVSHPVGIGWRNVDHKLFATGAALGAIHLWRNCFVEPENNCINLSRILPVDKAPEPVIFGLPFIGQPGDQGSIGLYFFDNKSLGQK